LAIQRVEELFIIAGSDTRRRILAKLEVCSTLKANTSCNASDTVSNTISACLCCRVRILGASAGSWSASLWIVDVLS